MINAEEYILDIKVEDKTMETENNFIYSPVYQIDDINSVASTVTAPETGFQPKNLRILIKKLPKKVLNKYFANMTPPRTSKRLKMVPAKYEFMSMTKLPKTNKNAIEIIQSHNTPVNKSKGISKNSITIAKTTKTYKKHYSNKSTKSPNKTHTKENRIDPVIVESSKILVIKQPVLKNDPLNLPNNMENLENNNLQKSNSNRNEENAMETVDSSGTETVENTATETVDSNGSEIVERIYFTNKSVQTKFTCNGSICGLVDSDEFNLNCFYCYKIFPLHKWLEFKQHVKFQHNVKEKQNQKQIPEQIIIDDVEESTINKSILRSQEINRINLNSSGNLNFKTPSPNAKVININAKLPLNHSAMSYQLQRTKNYVDLRTMPTKSPLKNTACNISSNQYNKMSSPTNLYTNQQLNQSKEISPTKLYTNKQLNLSKELSSPTKLYTNQQLNQSKELSSPIKQISKSNSNQTEEFIDITSENENSERTISVDGGSKSSVDEIISIDDDEEEDQEFDEIIENFSKEYQINKKASIPKIQTSNNSSLNMAAPTANTSATVAGNLPHRTSPILRLPNLPHITVKKIDAINAPTVTAPPTPQTSSSVLRKAYIKLPTNFDIEDVLKTIPKPMISPQNSTSLSPTKARYFVVKKVVKPKPKTQNVNLPRATIMTNISNLKENDDDDDMPSNDENEDEIPKPTNGCGILFGLTHREVVLHFLLKLKTYPELWRPQTSETDGVNYDQSIEELCKHLNHRFDLNIDNFEMRLSIQRVKDWYYRMLKNIFLHSLNRKNVEPYKHTFPEYFKILNQFLTSDVHYTKNLLLSKSKSSETDKNKYPKWMMYKKDSTTPKVTITHLENEKENGQLTQEQPPKKAKKAIQPKKPIIKFKHTKLPEDDSSQNIIEFDADTLYGNESTDEELLLPPDSPKKKPKWKSIHSKYLYKYPKRTKVYCPLVPIVCDVCGRNFKRNIDLRRHYVSHFPPKFQCPICLQMFYHKFLAEKCCHERQKKRKVCTDDPQDDSLVIVSPIKSKPKFPLPPNYKPWMCEMCGVSYRSGGSLSAHKRDKHFNQRLKCVVCKFTAVTNYRIVQHQKKRHVVEPGTVEEVAKRCRARMDSKTPFTPEARQEFDWRREQRKKLKPGELFYGCCKCRIIFQTRKEKVLHNKMEHPIKDTTVICLLCLPDKMLLSNSNSVRRHYTDIHKVPWDEIDDLVKRTKPIFQLLDKEEIELLNTSQNYTELLSEFLIKKKLKLEPDLIKDEATQAVEVLANQHYANDIEVEAKEEHNRLVDVTKKTNQEADENVFVDGIIDHDYNNADDENYKYEHNYNEIQETNNCQSNDNDDEQINVNNDDDFTHTEFFNQSQSNDQEEINVDECGYIIQCEDGLIEESIVEEFVAEDFIEEDTIEDYF